MVPMTPTAAALEELRTLALQLKPHLKGSAGPAHSVSHIMAAVLIARDSFGARAACRAVPGVPENANGRVNKLALRVRALLIGEPS